MKEKFKKVGQAVSLAELATGQSEQEVLFGGLEEQLSELIDFVSELENQLKKLGGQESEEAFAEAGKAEKKAQDAAEDLKVKLQDQIEFGAVTVETRDNKVFVSVGTGGAFPSGSANLTVKRKKLLTKLQMSATEAITALLLRAIQMMCRLPLVRFTATIGILQQRAHQAWCKQSKKAGKLVLAGWKQKAMVKRDRLRIIPPPQDAKKTAVLKLNLNIKAEQNAVAFAAPRACSTTEFG